MMSSFTYMKNNMFNPEELLTHFTVQDKEKGCVELIENGSSVMVNNYNKETYIRMVLAYYGYQKANLQIDSFLEGLYEVIPAKTLNLLNIEDLEKLMVGVTKIDIQDWKDYTKYTGENAGTENKVIQYFWETLESLDDNQLRKFLQFCTGCRSVPIDGFKSLKNNRQEKSLFTINLVKSNHHFIRAHTCFNRIDLPELSRKY